MFHMTVLEYTGKLKVVNCMNKNILAHKDVLIIYPGFLYCRLIR